MQKPLLHQTTCCLRVALEECPRLSPVRPLALAAVQGDLEEAPEVAECLLAFLFHYLLADDRITCLTQGALQTIACSNMCTYA